MKNIGLILKLARVAQGFTQRDIAQLSKVSQSLIAQIENGGVKNPSLNVRIALAKSLEQPIELFLANEDLEIHKEKESLVEMLVRCGVDHKAALLLVNSIREKSRGMILTALEKAGENQNEH